MTNTDKIQAACESYEAAYRAYQAAEREQGRLPGESLKDARARLNPARAAARAGLVALATEIGMARTYTQPDGTGVRSTCEAYSAKRIGYLEICSSVHGDSAEFTPAKSANATTKQAITRARVMRNIDR